MNSWVVEESLAIAGDQRFSRLAAIEQAIRETIEEAARRCRAVEDACMEPGADLGAQLCAWAIEAMLEPEVKR